MTSEGHDHSDEGVSMLVGDGTRAAEVGYRLRQVRLPETVGEPGRVSFEVERYDGAPVTDYLVDHTKELHLYVVRSDLAVFRHLHPTISADGIWSGRVNLPEPGDYRVVTEFVARDESGRGDHVMLGRSVTVDGDGRVAPPEPPGAADDGVVAVSASDGVAAGPEGRLELVVSDVEGGPVELGSYLGAQAHVVGFSEVTGAAVHLHPDGPPVTGPDGSVLVFDTSLPEPGGYVMFVQVRVDGFLHTVPLRVQAS